MKGEQVLTMTLSCPTILRLAERLEEHVLQAPQLVLVRKAMMVQASAILVAIEVCRHLPLVIILSSKNDGLREGNNNNNDKQQKQKRRKQNKNRERKHNNDEKKKAKGQQKKKANGQQKKETKEQQKGKQGKHIPKKPRGRKYTTTAVTVVIAMAVLPVANG